MSSKEESTADCSIVVDGLGKSFPVYKSGFHRLCELLVRDSKIGERVGYRENSPFWALKDVSFSVPRGTTLGILGQNGSGKSTLLQIIAGTMSPTTGTVKTQGKIAALLELGSGFNPEFSGRENVYFNAGLMGLTRNQVDAKFDTIAGFADIGEYLDQPTRTYSSGMLVRLAFAVQVALDPEILIVDEALAVGDAKFQLKCFKRINSLKEAGTTILFVSHAAELVRSLCEYGLVLERGKTIFWGEARPATVKYLSTIFPNQSEIMSGAERLDSETITVNQGEFSDGVMSVNLKEGASSFGVGGAKLDKFEIHELSFPNVVKGGERVRFVAEFSWEIELIAKLINQSSYEKNISLGIAFSDVKGSYLFGGNGIDFGIAIDPTVENSARLVVEFSLPYLAEGDYFVTVGIALGDLRHHVQLRWYDSIIQLRVANEEKKVFGVLAVDYQMRRD